MKKPALLIVIMLWSFCSLCSLPDQNQDREPSLQRPDVSIIAVRLLEHANHERMKRNLVPLEPYTDLISLALRHSQDMASHRNLTHLSTTGQSYLERVVDAGFYFIKIGENVAVSETFRDDIIHQELMSSPEHRENILDPDFDRIGIGIVYKEKKYYITQDYLQSLKILGIEEAEKAIQNEINGLIGLLSTPKEQKVSMPTSAKGPPVIVRCKRWDDFKKLAAGADTVSFLLRETEKGFQADALKNGRVLTFSGEMPEDGQLLRFWLATQLNVEESQIFEGILAVG